MKRMIRTAALGLGLLAVTATAQDMMRHIDLSSPDMVSAEMTRGEIEAARSLWRPPTRRPIHRMLPNSVRAQQSGTMA